MAILSEVRDQLALKFEVLLPHLNERQRSLLLAAGARLLGHRRVRVAARLTGVSETTVRKGVFELEAGGDLCLVAVSGVREGDARVPGIRTRDWFGRCRRWWSRTSGVTLSRRSGGRPSRCGTLPGELARQGHVVPAPTVGRLRRENGFSLQGNAKTLEGEQHPDRDAPFCQTCRW